MHSETNNLTFICPYNQLHTANDIIRNFFLYLFTRTNNYDPLQHFRQKGDKINTCDNTAYNTCNVTQIQIRSNIPFHPQDLISNSPYYLPYSSYDVSSENLLLDQLIIPWLTFFSILITCLLDIVLIL